MSSLYGKGPKGKATRLHAELVRSCGFCERCGRSPANLQCAHIIPRRYSNTRTDERNAWCLCAGCHLRLTEHADEHMAFVRATIGMAEFRRLKAKSQRLTKVDWPAEVARLSELLKAVV